MWRIFNGIPRAIRQHCHGPRTATGVHGEEERTEFVTRCEGSTENTNCKERFIVTYNGIHSDIGQDHTGPNADYERRDWWRTCHGDFWSLFHGQHSTLEAVTWGAAVVLGLQLSRRERRWHKEVKPRRHSLLYHIAFALPTSVSSAQCIKDASSLSHGPQHLPQGLEFDEKCQVDDQQKKIQTANEDDQFSAVVNDFEETCNKLAAVDKSVLGLHLAQSGNMTDAITNLKASSSLGHATSSFNMGVCFENGMGVDQSLTEAVKYYQLAADAGHAQALYNLALLYQNGDGGLERDTKTALLLLEKAAQKGLAQAQTYLGVYYTEDEQLDMDKAVSFFKAAANQDDPEAQYFLGICYEQGWGVTVSDLEAANYYRKSAESGHPGAQYNLGVFLENGLGGLPQDKKGARDLFEKAAGGAYDSAIHKLQEIDAQAIVKADSRHPESRAKEKEPESPKLRLSPSFSMPSLTEYVREHLSQLAIGQLWFFDHLLPRSRSLSASDEDRETDNSRVIFTLGDDEEESSISLETDATLGMQETHEMNTESLTQKNSSLTYLGVQKNWTMPELQTVACP